MASTTTTTTEACHIPVSAGEEIIRPLGNFAPSMWGDLFLSPPIHNQVDEAYIAEQIQRLKEEVREMLIDTGVDRSKKMETVNCLHRLGLSHHFETEIHIQLKTHYDNIYNEDDKEYDLYTISTQFRVFRQYGYKMSCDVFNKFKDASGKFMDTLTNDVAGMLSLYEASHLRVRGEDVLEEALAFSTSNLKRMEYEFETSHFLAKQVTRALKEPLHFGIPRVDARAYISIYEDDHHESRNESILKLAKLDFNMQQKMHQQELHLVSKWWQDLEFHTKLPYVRDRVVEAYFYANTNCPEPCQSLARIILAKVTLIVTVLDDTYDAFGTFKELQLFTHAINRWDMSAIDELPDNMKFIYTKLLTLYVDFHKETSGDAQLYGVPDSIERMKELCRSYYEEAKWLNDGYIPNMDDEYTQVAYISITADSLVTPSCIGMGRDFATKESFEYLRGIPKIMKVSRAICRLQNDISGREFEQKRGHTASAVECYMKQYGVPFEEAVGELRKRIVDGWKDLNEECLKPTTVPLHFRKWYTNLVRFTGFMYKDVDGFTQPRILKYSARLMFVDPIPI